jgi:Ca2+-transporting ATPase
LRGERSLAVYMERTLRSCKGILRVAANPTTGTVLVLFTRKHTPEKLASLIHKILKERTRVPGLALAPAQPVKPPAWLQEETSLRPWYNIEADQVVRYFSASPVSGLAEADAADRLAMHGPNILPGIAARTETRIFASHLKALPVLLTGAAAGLSVLTGGFIQGLLALGVAITNAAVGTFFEIRAERTLESARESIRLRALVRRNAQLREIPFESVVLGDILELQVGSRVPADARVIEADHLSVDEAALTGESIPVTKSPAVLPDEEMSIMQHHNMLYRGTLVVEGSARAVVVATGNQTVLGQLQGFLGGVFPPEAVVAGNMRRLSREFIAIGIAAFGLLSVFSLLRGRSALQILRDGLALMAGAIPSGLSTLAVSAFALGHRDLRRNQILVRRLRALGNLASTQVVCFDKTGTLTLNRMTVSALYAGTRRISIPADSLGAPVVHPDLKSDPEVSWLISLSVLCNEAFMLHDGARSLEGSSTEKALIHLAENAGVNTTSFRGDHPILDIFYRTEEHHFMVTLHHWAQDQQLTAIKGSPLEVLELCSHLLQDGQILPMQADDRSRIEAENFNMAGAGLRVLGVAYGWGTEGNSEARRTDGARLVWVGLIGLADPLRKGARELIQDLHRAGIRTAVITGDQSLTAQHLGEELNLSGDAPLSILDAKALNSISPAAMQSVVTRTHVFARLSPTQKLQIIQAYQGAGKGVVMVGDGFNDVLALQVADVGIALGREGADLARKTADLVLEDDDLGAVKLAIANGRTFYGNMRNSLRFLMTATEIDILVELLSRGAAAAPGTSPYQSIWTNLACLALAADPVESDAMSRAPIGADATLISASDVEHTFLDMVGLSAASGVAGLIGLARYGMTAEAGRLFWASVSINQLLYAFTARGKDGAASDHRPPNRLLQTTLGVAVGGRLLATVLAGGNIAASAVDIMALAAGAWLSRQLLQNTKPHKTVPAADIQLVPVS